jgi:DNA repair protein RadC
VPEAKTNAGQRLTHMNTLLTNRIAEVSLTYSSKVPASERIQVKSSHDAEKAFRLVFPDLEYREYFYVMLLNRANKILGTFQVSSGGITGTVVDPRLVFQSALKANATSIIIAHNHPSGQLTASQADKDLTKKLKDGGAVLDIPVLDHLIITESNYYSFADDGIM